MLFVLIKDDMNPFKDDKFDNILPVYFPAEHLNQTKLEEINETAN